MDKDLETICLNQFIRPQFYILQSGVGNCKICTPDKNNIMCKAYYPVYIRKIENMEEIKNGKYK